MWLSSLLLSLLLASLRCSSTAWCHSLCCDPARWLSQETDQIGPLDLGFLSSIAMSLTTFYSLYRTPPPVFCYSNTKWTKQHRSSLGALSPISSRICGLPRSKIYLESYLLSWVLWTNTALYWRYKPLGQLLTVYTFTISYTILGMGL